MTTRQPVKSVNKTVAQIAANAAAEKARKAASKAALKSVQPSAETDKPKKARTPKPAAPLMTQAVVDTKKAQEAVNALAAMRVDYDSYEGQLKNDDDTPQTFEQYLAEQGLQTDGTPRAASAVAKPGSYQGPMLALRAAAKSYVTGKNGNPHCNDWLAELLAGLTQPQVVQCLIAAMKLEGNPYIHLNPGQQSMNLRNKARGMAKAGALTEADLTAAIERESRHPTAAK